MGSIRISHLSFSYPGSSRLLFDDFSLDMPDSWKLGLCGRNGMGKTTLLGIMSGEVTGYSGSVTSAVSLTRFPFSDPEGDPDALEAASLAGGAPAWQAERELRALEMDPRSFGRPFRLLSPGERSIVMLAALFLREGTFGLIDEPAAHLDDAARAAVGRYLALKDRGFILVSHDRALLDACTDHTLALIRTGTSLCAGSFSVWREEKDRRDAFEEAQNSKLTKEIARLEESSRRTAGWAEKTEASKKGAGPVDRGYIGHKSAKMAKRAQSSIKRAERGVAERKELLRDVDREMPLRMFPSRPAAAGPLIDAAGLVLRLASGMESSPVTLRLTQGDRLCLTGGSGTGKSALLEAFASGKGDFAAGNLRLSSDVFSLAGQDTGGLSGSAAHIAARAGIEPALFLAVLSKLGFEREDLFMDAADCSSGQKKKILLALSMCTRAAVYLWDEPLEHVDLFTRIQIEEMILREKPTMIFTEHDTAFISAVATGFIRMAQ